MATLTDQTSGCRVEPNGSILVPTERLVEFLAAAHAVGTFVPYIECLFKLEVGGTQPSMMLSASADQFSAHGDFLAFAADAASKALEQAVANGSKAYFEVGAWIGSAQMSAARAETPPLTGEGEPFSRMGGGPHGREKGA